MVAACCDDDKLHALRVWSLQTGEPVAVLRGHEDTVILTDVSGLYPVNASGWVDVEMLRFCGPAGFIGSVMGCGVCL